MPDFTDDEILSFMGSALNEAKLALETNEVAVGCVIVNKSKREIIIKSSNSTNQTRNSIVHCEFDAINKLLKLEPNGYITCNDVENLHNFTSKYALFVTCEPCIMCTTALQMIGLLDIYYGCRNEKFGGCGSVLPLHTGNGNLPKLNCTGGILLEESINLLQTFYSRGNPNAPNPKRKCIEEKKTFETK